MFEIARVINRHDASLEEKLTAVYLPKDFLKITTVYLFCLYWSTKAIVEHLSYFHPYGMYVHIQVIFHFISTADISLCMAYMIVKLN